jgi:hypothetical protein
MSDESGPPDTRPPGHPPKPPKPSHAGHQPPARRDQDARSQESSAVATNGGPGFTTPQPLGPPRFAEGRHRLVGQVVEASGKNPRPQSRPPKARPYGSQPLNPATPYRKP